MSTAENVATGAILDGWRSLARHTNLPVATIGKMAIAGELRSLFDTTTGGLLPEIEIRSRFGGAGLTPLTAREDLRKKAPGISGREALDELARKRRSWTFP